MIGQKGGPSPKTTSFWVHLLQRTGPHALAIYQIISCLIDHLAAKPSWHSLFSGVPGNQVLPYPMMFILQSHYIRIYILLRDYSLGNPRGPKIQECIRLQPVQFEGSISRPYSPSADAATGIYLVG